MLTGPQEFIMQVALQSKSPNNMVKERDWGHRVHPPLKSREHKQLHSLNGFRLEHILRICHLKKIRQILALRLLCKHHCYKGKIFSCQKNKGRTQHTWKSNRRGTSISSTFAAMERQATAASWLIHGLSF